jgi:hypothetical protein
VALACTAAGLATFGCANSGAKGVGTPLVLNLYDTSGGVDWTDSVTGDPAARKGGGYWKGTYDEDKDDLQFGNFVLPHYGATWGTTGYWGGFTTGTNGDSSNYGYADTSHHVGSVDWIDNQWGIMATGGIDPDGNYPVKGTPYLIAYGSGSDMKVSLNGDSLFNPQEIWICTHPWPYYGNFFGDGFARPLNQSGDYFILNIQGINESGTLVGTVTDTLAVYDPSAPYSVRQKSNWHSVLFPSRWTNIKYISFTLVTTDVGEYGPNTAFYFCMDKLKVTKTGGVASTSTSIKDTTTAVWYEVTDNMKLNSYTGGVVTVHDAKGKKVLETSIKAGGDSINLSKLPAGEYHVRHGHRTIPIKKIN